MAPTTGSGFLGASTPDGTPEVEAAPGRTLDGAGALVAAPAALVAGSGSAGAAGACCASGTGSWRSGPGSLLVLANPRGALDARVDAWLVDNSMPIMGGMELTRRLRAMGVTAPIVGVTGNALAEDRDAFLAAGATAVALKPCSIARLREVFAELGQRLPDEDEHEGGGDS